MWGMTARSHHRKLQVTCYVFLGIPASASLAGRLRHWPHGIALFQPERSEARASLSPGRGG
jgi:hypothetical protein